MKLCRAHIQMSGIFRTEISIRFNKCLFLDGRRASPVHGRWFSAAPRGFPRLTACRPPRAAILDEISIWLFDRVGYRRRPSETVPEGFVYGRDTEKPTGSSTPARESVPHCCPAAFSIHAMSLPAARRGPRRLQPRSTHRESCLRDAVGLDKPFCLSG